jgi:hypothetical protein
MIVNLIVIALILFFAFQFSRTKFRDSDENRKKYIKIISIILILQSGLRNVAVGADTYAYFLKFEDVKIMSWLDIYASTLDFYKFGIGKNPGYLAYQKVIQLFTLEYQIFLMIVAVIFFSALGNFIYKNTTRLIDVIIAFIIYSVLFFEFFSITGTRQTLVTAATLYGFELIKKRKMIQFFTIILLASTIHKSVLVFLPFYFIANISKTKLLYILALILFPFFIINRFLISAYLKVQAGYENYEVYEGAGTFTFTILFLLISLGAMLRIKIIVKNNSFAKYYYNAFTIALILIPLTWVNPSAMRVVQYFSIFMLLLIPEIIFSFRTISFKVQRDVSISVIIILIGLFIKSKWGDIIPYGFFWEEMRLPENYF